MMRGFDCIGIGLFKMQEGLSKKRIIFYIKI